ncbi:transposable element Tcb1 transposase [Trichonephila clavipes]|nr:transposable element Tcb1 transposase [Trichonephila clavipes]
MELWVGCIAGSRFLTVFQHDAQVCGNPGVKVSDHGRHVMSSSPVPLKTHRVGQRCTLNLSRADTSSRWCGVNYHTHLEEEYANYRKPPDGTDHNNESVREGYIRNGSKEVKLFISALKVFQGNNRIVMAHRKHLDDFLLGRIIGQLECGRIQLEVSEELEISQSVISRLLQQFQNDGNVSRCYSTGSPPAELQRE